MFATLSTVLKIQNRWLQVSSTSCQPPTPTSFFFFFWKKGKINLKEETRASWKIISSYSRTKNPLDSCYTEFRYACDILECPNSSISGPHLTGLWNWTSVPIYSKQITGQSKPREIVLRVFVIWELRKMISSVNGIDEGTSQDVSLRWVRCVLKWEDAPRKSSRISSF